MHGSRGYFPGCTNLYNSGIAVPIAHYVWQQRIASRVHQLVQLSGIGVPIAHYVWQQRIPSRGDQLVQ